jgi:hypothetical protein
MAFEELSWVEGRHFSLGPSSRQNWKLGTVGLVGGLYCKDCLYVCTTTAREDLSTPTIRRDFEQQRESRCSLLSIFTNYVAPHTLHWLVKDLPIY